MIILVISVHLRQQHHQQQVSSVRRRRRLWEHLEMDLETLVAVAISQQLALVWRRQLILQVAAVILAISEALMPRCQHQLPLHWHLVQAWILVTYLG